MERRNKILHDNPSTISCFITFLSNVMTFLTWTAGSQLLLQRSFTPKKLIGAQNMRNPRTRISMRAASDLTR